MATPAATPANKGKASLPGSGRITGPQSSPQPIPQPNYRNRRNRRPNRRSNRRSSLDITQNNSANRHHTPFHRASLDLTQSEFVGRHRRFDPRSSANSPSPSFITHLAELDFERFQQVSDLEQFQQFVDFEQFQQFHQNGPMVTPTFPMMVNNMNPRFPLPPPVDLSTLAMDLAKMSAMKASEFGIREIQVLNNIRSGPPIIDYWNEQHPLWTELKCVFNNDPEYGHLIPATIGAKLIHVIQQITHECTAPTVNPTTRVSGIYALLQIIKWVCKILDWPLEFHNLDLSKTFWYRDDPLDMHTTARADDAIAQIVIHMPRAERELIYRRVCQLPIMSEMEAVIWQVTRARLRFRHIKFFEHIRVPLEILEGAALVRQ